MVNPYALGRQRATADDPPHLGNNNAAAVVGGGGQFGGIVASMDRLPSSSAQVARMKQASMGKVL